MRFQSASLTFRAPIPSREFHVRLLLLAFSIRVSVLLLESGLCTFIPFLPRRLRRGGRNRRVDCRVLPLFENSCWCSCGSKEDPRRNAANEAPIGAGLSRRSFGRNAWRALFVRGALSGVLKSLRRIVGKGSRWKTRVVLVTAKLSDARSHRSPTGGSSAGHAHRQFRSRTPSGSDAVSGLRVKARRGCVRDGQEQAPRKLRSLPYHPRLEPTGVPGVREADS